ncbi:SA1320 family protein [Salipaludibacillus sp. HK11]|uniref:SA1320 family protein n=1 Tax=Salipaludibacillus sp. HK11 TaxID=3394320 RepID=UPI0039FC34D2
MTVTIPEINSSTTSDKNLVELAGFHVYEKYEKRDIVEVDGNSFIVRDDNFEKDSTGLDAMTVENIESGEYHIIFMGTDHKGKYGKEDLITNVNLLTSSVPEQLVNADEYFDKMEKEFGEISSVAGNSLGGALANTVAVRHPHVRSVTLNPAPLPASELDKQVEYENITNYISEYDVLNQALEAGRLDHQVPGEKRDIYNGIPTFGNLGSNHTGYFKDENGNLLESTTIGNKGEPGYGKIYVNAHDHIVDSIWTGTPLYGGRSDRIDLKVDHIIILGQSINTSVQERIGLSHQYVRHSVEIIEHESASFDERVNKLREVYQDMFENSVDGSLLKGIRHGNSMFKQTIEALRIILYTIEIRCQSLNTLLNSPPMELLEFVTGKSINVESIFSELKGYLDQLEEEVEKLSSFVEETTMNKIEEIFKGGQKRFHDVVVGELESHFHHVERNYQQVVTQVDEFGLQVIQMAEAFAKRDESLGNAIANQSALEGLGTGQVTNIYQMEDSPYLLEFMRIKEISLSLAMDGFKGSSFALLLPILTTISRFILLLESMGETITTTLKTGTNIFLLGHPASLIIDMFTNFHERVRNSLEECLQPIDEWMETLQGIRIAVDKLRNNYPDLVDNLRPYVDSALFNDSNYYNVHIYNSAATSILKEMQVIFDDIVYQLSNNEAKAITELHDVSKNVKINMGKLEEQIERAATW